MAAKSRLLLYYECNCNTQANIAHAVITTVRRYRGRGTATGHTLVAGGHFSKLNSTRLNRTHGTFGVSWPDGRIVRIVAKLTDIPVLVSNACHFIYYTHTPAHTLTSTLTHTHSYGPSNVLFRFYRLKMRNCK